MSQDKDKKKSKSLNDNTTNLYEQLRCKIGDTYYFWLGLIEEALEEAENGKRLSDRHRGLFEGQRLVKQLKSSTYPMKATYNKSIKSENDIDMIEREYGKEVAEYERARAGVWKNDDNQS